MVFTVPEHAQREDAGLIRAGLIAPVRSTGGKKGTAITQGFANGWCLQPGSVLAHVEHGWSCYFSAIAC